MSTKNQYDVFKAIYDEEFDRYADLRNTGKLFVGICSFFLGALAFKAKELFLAEGLHVKIILAVAMSSFFIALLLLVKSLGVASYEGMFSPRSVVEGLGSSPLDDGKFFDDRIVDIVVASERNWATNRNRAKLIQIAMYSMVIGIAAASVAVLVAML